MSYKLIQLNLWQGRLIRHAVRFLAQEKPDFVCLQEVYDATDDVPAWDAFSGLKCIQEALPGYHCFFAPLYAFDVNNRRVTSGNAILSRFALQDQHVAFTNGKFVTNPLSGDNTRNLQWCQAELPDGKRLSLLNHHGFWFPSPVGVPESVPKMQQVKDVADSLPQPLIICGDMNVIPQSKPMQLFEGSFENLTKTYGLATTLSPLAGAFDQNNQVACDNVLISPGVQANTFTTTDYLVSDHKPLILTFDL